MKTERFEHYTVDFSEDLDSENLELIAEAINPLTGLNFDFNSLDSRILVGHGNSEEQFRMVHYPRDGGRYSNDNVYTGTRENIQDWIDRYDGEHNVLAIVSCNTHAKLLQSSKSILVYPMIPISVQLFCEGMQDFFKGKEQYCLRIHLPKRLRQRLFEK